MKNKILVVFLVLLIVVVIILSAGTVYLFKAANNANDTINDLNEKISRLENTKLPEQEVSNDNEKEEEKELVIDNSKEGNKIWLYREQIEEQGVKATVSDNTIYFFVSETAGNNVSPFDGLEVKVEGADIIQAKFIHLGSNSVRCLVLVLSDGTVKYVTRDNILERNIQFKTIEDLNNVLALRGIAVKEAEKTYDTAVVIKKDGTTEFIDKYFN